MDFTWDSLRHADIVASSSYAKGMDAAGNALKSAGIDSKLYFEGALRPAENVDAIKSIAAPFPDSDLNSQKSNEMPKDRSLLQRMLSEEAGQPTNTNRV